MREVRAGSELIEEATAVLVEALRTRLATQDRVALALSGGSTPLPVLRRLAEAAIDWPRVDVYQVDERVAPEGDPARNLTGLTEALLDRVPAVAHPMPVDAPDLARAAARYATRLPAALDIVHLGLGDDGHTASLVPGDPVLDIVDQRVALTGAYRGHHRMTLTFPALDSAALVVWIVAKAGKTEAIQRLRDADPSIPAGRVARSNAVLITDG